MAQTKIAHRTTHAALAVGSSVCQCGGCGLVFKSVTSFDKHRVGPGDARRCLTPDEMRSAGMSVNGRGQWVASVYDGAYER